MPAGVVNTVAIAQRAIAAPAIPSRPGRPRLLTLDQVLDGALAIGLDRFNMGVLAEHLGVGVATLYQYVSGRDALVRLAVSRQVARLPLPRDTGQPWTDYVREYALGLQDALAAEPRSIAQFAEGGFGFESEVEMVDGFLAVLISRGFALAEAVRVVRHTGFIAFGAAVVIARERANAAKGEDTRAAVGRAIDRSRADLPLMRAAADLYTAETSQLAAELLQPFINQIAHQRGEVID